MMSTKESDGLTRRERDAAVLVAKGLTNQQIADELSIQIGSAKALVHRCLLKCGVQKRGQLALIVRRSMELDGARRD